MRIFLVLVLALVFIFCSFWFPCGVHCREDGFHERNRGLSFRGGERWAEIFALLLIDFVRAGGGAEGVTSSEGCAFFVFFFVFSSFLSGLFLLLLLRYAFVWLVWLDCLSVPFGSLTSTSARVLLPWHALLSCHLPTLFRGWCVLGECVSIRAEG